MDIYQPSNFRAMFARIFEGQALKIEIAGPHTRISPSFLRRCARFQPLRRNCLYTHTVS